MNYGPTLRFLDFTNATMLEFDRSPDGRFYFIPICCMIGKADSYCFP